MRCVKGVNEEKGNDIMKKICCIALIILMLSASCLVAVGCQATPADKPLDKPDDDSVSQDLSMFDNKKHYGLEQVKLYKLTLLTPDASFADGSISVELAENSTLPDIVYGGMGYVVGVKTVDGDKVYAPYAFRMPARNLDIIVSTSVEKPPYSAVLVPGVGNNGSVAIDISSAAHNAADKVDEGSILTVNPSFSVQLSERSVDVFGNNDDVLRGCVLSLSGKTGNFARILTGSSGAKGTEQGIQTNRGYTFTYYLENKGETAISFKLYQTQSDIKLNTAVAVSAGKTITLLPGEHVGYTIEFVANNENGNILPLLQLQSDCTNARLGIAILKTNGIVAHRHDLHKIDAYTAPKDGTSNVEYYGCDKCGAIFTDGEGKNEASVLDVFSKSEQ